MVSPYHNCFVNIWRIINSSARICVCSIYLYNFLILSLFKNKLQTSDGIFLDPSFDETTKNDDVDDTFVSDAFRLQIKLLTNNSDLVTFKRITKENYQNYHE